MMNMEAMGKIWNVVHGLRPILLMVLIQILFSVLIILYKLASEYGMPMKVLTAYRYTFGTAIIAPLAFFMERKRRPKLTWMVVLQAFTSAFFGMSLAQNMYAESLVLTSATFATAMVNLVPAFTFFMAILFRLEKLDLNNIIGKAKLVGTLTSISGAMILTIYKGVEIRIWSTSIDFLHKNEQQGSVAVTHHQHINHNTHLGSLLAVASCFCVAFGLIIQAKMCVKYPCHYSCTAIICSFGALQSVVYAICFERNWNQWKLGFDVRLIASLYAGVVVIAFAGPITMWCVRTRGPSFVSIFNPLLLVLVAISGSLFLKEKLYLGSVLGSAIIVCGLYIVIWGKSKEMKKVKQLTPSKSIEQAEQERCNSATVAMVDETLSIIPINPLAAGPSIIPPMNLSNDDDQNKEQNCEIEIVGKGNEDP